MGLGHRWREVETTYAEVNQLFGDIVKVTPSSKVVGDMALFLLANEIRPADLLELDEHHDSRCQTPSWRCFRGTWACRRVDGRRSCNASFCAAAP